MSAHGSSLGCPQDSPINAWAKFLAADLATRRAFDGRTVLGRNRLAAVDPVPNVLLLQSDGGGQTGLASEEFDSSHQCIHEPTIPRLLSESKQMWFAPKTTVRDTRQMEKKDTNERHLGARIKEALGDAEAKSLLAKVPGLTQQALSNLMTRDSRTSEYAIRIADALGVSVRWLLDGQGERDSPEWPFSGIERARFDALTYEQRLEIQGVVRDRLERFEVENSQDQLVIRQANEVSGIPSEGADASSIKMQPRHKSSRAGFTFAGNVSAHLDQPLSTTQGRKAKK